jgi:outer membrane receptor protein involved in Fe transport
LFALLALGLILAIGLIAQTETGQITGTIQDPTGAVVPNATLSAQNVATGAQRSTTTNSTGLFVLPNLTPGTWDVTISAGGFATQRVRSVVEVGAKITMDRRLEVGTASTTVEVAAGAVQVNTESQTLSATINSQQVTELPSLTRNPYDFVATVPNVASDTNSGRGVGYAINGMRSASTNVLLDGVANNDEFTATVGQQVPLDSVQEYTVQTSNFTAEYGRATGGIVNLITRGGTNEFHGSAYEFNRISALASNSYYNNANGLDKGIYTRNLFGYSLGGPVKKNKLFFFQNTEWTRVRSYGEQVFMIPTSQLIAASNANTQSFFSAYGAQRSDLTTLGTYTKNDLPTACKGGAATGACAALAGTTPMFNKVAYKTPADAGGGSPQNAYDLVGNVDYNPNERSQMSFRYALYSELDFPGTVDTSPYKGYETGQTYKNNHLTVSFTHTYSPTLVSQTRLSYNRLSNEQPLGTAPIGPTLYMNASGVPLLAGAQVVFPGYSETTPGNAIPFGGPQNFVILTHDVTKVVGRHNIRFGGLFTYMQDNRTFGAYESAVESLGSNTGNSLDNFLGGQLRQFQAAIYPQGKYPGDTLTLPVGPPNFSRSNRYKEYAVYGQDNIKVTARLSINLGIRWEYFGVPHNSNPALDSNFVFGTGSTIQQQIATGKVYVANQSPVGGLWHKDFKDFAPRIGFAYSLTQDGKTSIRGGYGISYERNFGNVTFNVIQNPPNYAVISLQAGVDLPTIPISVSNAGPLAGSNGTKVFPAPSLRAVDPNIKNAYAHLLSLSLERQISTNILAALSYSGSMGERLYSIDGFNRVSYGNLYLGIPCTPGGFGDPGNCTARLNTQYGNINMRTGGGLSNYNSLAGRLRFSNIGHTGLTLETNYTYSHAIDNLSSTFSDGTNGNFVLGFEDPFHPELDRGSSDFNAKGRLSVSGIWAIPAFKGKSVADKILGGWEIAPIITARTGNPITLYDCYNAYSYCPRAFVTGAVSGTGVTNIPTGTPDNYNWYSFTKQNFSVGQWYNPKTGISDDAPFPGNMLGRGSVTGPGNFSFDMGLYKNTQITEKVKIQLRLEMYNVLNHSNFLVYGADADAGSADYVDGYRNGHRDVQLGAKIVF